MIKKFKYIFIFIFLVIFAFEVIYLFAVPKFVSCNLNKIINFVENKSGLALSYDKFKFKTKFDLSCSFNIENLNIKTKQNINILTVNQTNLAFYPLKLVFKTFDLKSFYAKNLNLNVCRDENGVFNFVNINFKPTDLKLKYNNINLKTYNISFDDKYVKNKIHFNGNDFLISKHKTKSLKAKIDGNLQVNDKNTDFNIEFSSKLPLKKHFFDEKFVLEGYVKNFDTSNLVKYFPTTPLFVNGDLLVKTASDSSFNKHKIDILINKFKYQDINLQDKTKIVSDVYFKNENLFFENSIVENNFLKVVADGEIKNAFSNKPDLNLNLKLNEIKLEDLADILPSSYSGKELYPIVNLKKYKIFGKLNGQLEIKGKTSEPKVYGKLLANDCYVVKSFQDVPKAKVEAKFNGETFDLNTKVYANKNEFVKIEGTSKLYDDRSGDYKIVSSDNVDLSRAMVSLIPIKKIIGFKLGPLPYMKICGLGNINLHAKGTLDESFLYGKFNFKNTSVEYDSINGTIKNAYGFLNFNGKDMHFETLKAMINNDSIKVVGDFTIYSDVNLKISSNSLDADVARNLVVSSVGLKQYSHNFELISKLTNKLGIDLSFVGKIDENKGENLIDDLNCHCDIKMKDNDIYLKFLNNPICDLNGKIEYKTGEKNKEELVLNLNGKFNNDKITVKTDVKDSKHPIIIESQNVDLANCLKSFINPYMLKQLGIKDSQVKLLSKVSGKLKICLKYYGNISNFELNKLVGKLEFLNLLKDKNGYPLKITNGEIKLDDNLYVHNLKISGLPSSNIHINGNIHNIFKKRNVNLSFVAQNFDLSFLNSYKDLNLKVKELDKIFNVYENFKGDCNCNLKIKNDGVFGGLNINNLRFNHSVLKFPIVVNATNINLMKNKIEIKSLTGEVDKTPIFLKSEIHNFNNPYIRGYFTFKLTDNLVTKAMNSFMVYPIKVKGDINVLTDFVFYDNNLNLHPVLRLNEGADITYMGANIGDEDVLREIRSLLYLSDNKVDLKNIEYIKYVQSQNNKKNPLKMMSLTGTISNYKDYKNGYLNNIHIKTEKPLNARLLNIIFKKSIFKEGIFNCDVRLNGKLQDPKIVGYFDILNANMPLYNTKIKTLNMQFKSNNMININSTGSTLNSDFEFDTRIRNNVNSPLKINNLNFHLTNLNLSEAINFISRTANSPTKSFNTVLTPNSQNGLNFKTNFDNLIIENANLNIDNVLIRNEIGKDFHAKVKMDNDGVLKIEKLSIEGLGGNLLGKVDYNLKTNKIDTKLTLSNLDANKSAKFLLEVENQIQGKLNGNLDLITTGETEDERLKNLDGNINFEINDGKLPKLGSLEYLLRAGNIIKRGPLGLTINNIIDLVVPIKTGYFARIKGDLIIKDSQVSDINIYSQGENMSVYVTGNYNYMNMDAKMNVYGKLSPSAVSLLGPIGNASISSLFSIIGKETSYDDNNLKKIPTLVKNDKMEQCRYFEAVVDGDINASNYVKSFKWLEN